MPTAPAWWTSYFDAGYLDEFSPWFDLVEDRRQVTRLLELLALPAGARVLDLACGQGRHAHLLAEAGFNVDGLDYSAALLTVAKARGTGSTLRYVRGDMRALPARWTRRFDGVVNLFTSFGFFDDARDDLRVLREVARVLTPGGTFIWQGGNRDGMSAAFLRGATWRSRRGRKVVQSRSFDRATGWLTIRTTLGTGARQEERTHRIRLYAPDALAALMRRAGLSVDARYTGFGEGRLTPRAHEMLIVARKPIRR